MSERRGKSLSGWELAAPVGEQLFRARKALGLTLIEVARAAGVSRTTVFSVEAGDSDPSISTFVKLCLAVDVNPPDLLKGRLR